MTPQRFLQLLKLLISCPPLFRPDGDAHRGASLSKPFPDFARPVSCADEQCFQRARAPATVDVIAKTGLASRLLREKRPPNLTGVARGILLVSTIESTASAKAKVLIRYDACRESSWKILQRMQKAAGIGKFVVHSATRLCNVRSPIPRIL